MGLCAYSARYTELRADGTDGDVRKMLGVDERLLSSGSQRAADPAEQLIDEESKPTFGAWRFAWAALFGVRCQLV